MIKRLTGFYKKVLKLSFILYFLLFFSSCGLTDNDQPIAAFMEISDPNVSTLPVQGEGTHKISDVWVFQNGQILGVFPLPTKVPVKVMPGGSDIIILAGIRNNGVNGSPVFYPFYKSVEFSISPTENQQFRFPMNFTYISEAKFSLVEGFEIGNIFTYDSDMKPETALIITDETSAGGTKSAKAVLTNAFPTLETASEGVFLKSNNRGGASYVELDYKGNAEIAVGLIKFTGQRGMITYKVIISPREDWNKIYIDLTDELSVSDYDTYKIAIAFSKPSHLNEAVAFIDNVKHIHF